MNHSIGILFAGWLLYLIGMPVFAQSGSTVVPSDSTEKPKVESFRITPEEEIIPQRWDTLLTGFQRFDPAEKKYTFPLKLGNIVSPAISADFTEQLPLSDAIFLAPYTPYLNDMSRQLFFRVRSPFTQLSYTSGGQKINLEQTLDVLHTQNVNEHLNVGIMMNFMAGEGQYSYQKESKKTFGLFSSYTGDRYSLFATAGSGRITRQENGGISDIGLVGLAKPKDLPTYLSESNGAQTSVKTQHLDLIQSYAFGTFDAETAADSLDGPTNKEAWGRLIYKMHYEKDGRSYTDNLPGSVYYRSFYFDPTETYDTTYFRSWNHELSLRLQSNPEKKFSLGSQVGLRYEMQKYLQNDFPDTVLVPVSDSIYNFSIVESFTDYVVNNSAVFGELMNEIGKSFRWKAEAGFYFQGYKTGNTHLLGEMEKSFGKSDNPAGVLIQGSLDITRPPYWVNHYFSNHFIWNNDFRFQKHIKIGGKLDLPAIRFSVSGRVSLYDQYIYFDSLAVPVQSGSTFLVYGGRVEKTFNLWKIRSQNTLALQYSSHPDVMPLPAVLIQSSTFFHHVFHFRSTGGQLDTELGFDFYYFTPFDGYAFMPATGIFYIQHKQQVGNYPFVDVFLNAKIKRTRFFVKVEHVNANLTGYNYFQVPDYPVNPLFLKMGLSWTFYD